MSDASLTCDGSSGLASPLDKRLDSYICALLVLITALVLALVAFALGMIFGIGSARKILGHLNEEACTHGPEVGALQKRFNISQFVNLGLGFVIIALMVVATEHSFLGL